MSDVRFRLILARGKAGDTADTILSIAAQLYDGWTLHMSADGLAPAIREKYERLVGHGRLHWHEGPDIPVTADDGAYAMPLVPGDDLSPDALAQFACVIAGNRNLDLVYADHGERFPGDGVLAPFFKPGWSPEFLTATDYVGRAVLRGRDLEGAGLTWAFDAIDLWGLWLRQSRREALAVDRVERIVMALAGYDWSPAVIAKARTVVARHLEQLGLEARIILPDWAERMKALAFDFVFPDDGPSVSIIIPSKNNWKILRRCVESLRNTSYRNYEVIVVDNASDDKSTLDYLSGLVEKVIRIPSPESGFSYSYVNNEAAKRSSAELLLFLNDDTEVITPGWLSNMVGWARRPGISSVGAKLYFPGDLIQHSGLVHNLLDGRLPAPAFKLERRHAIGARGQDRTVRNYAAVTAACMLTPRKTFLDAGGFDDADFSVAYNDCDYGFRLTRQGGRHVCIPNAELYHYEGATRGRGKGNDKISEEAAFIKKYHDWDDPFYNRNLSIDGFSFEPSLRSIIMDGHDIAGTSIALFTHNLNYEGAPLVLLDIARGLKERGAREVLIVSLVDGPLREVYEREDMRVILRPDVGVFGARQPEEIEHVLKPIVADLMANHVDVVIANTVICHWGVEAARLAEIPSLWVIHESEPPFSHLDPAGEHHLAMARRAFACTYLNVFVSAATKELYAPFAGYERSVVVYNGFDKAVAANAMAAYDRASERQRLNIRKEDLLFLLPGTVCARKAQHDLVRAIARLPLAVLHRARFVIVGDREGAYSRDLHRMIDALPDGKRESITVIQETPEIWRYYLAADCLVFTSHLESFPRVIQEAMFAKLAIISTPVFGISEQLRDGKSGLFFQPGDIAALCRAIERLVAEPALRGKLAEAAHVSLDFFPTLSKMQDEYVRLVLEALCSDDGSTGAPSFHSWLVDDTKAVSEWWSLLQ